MSSKSKKSSRKGGSAAERHGAAGGHGGEPAAPVRHVGPLEVSDEIVHVPKNTSPLRFVLMIGLVILLLIIFLVPDALQSTFRGDQGDETYVRWQIPGGEEVEQGYLAFRDQKRALGAALEIDPFLGPVVGADQRGNMSDESLARFLILEQLAVESGVAVPDVTLVAHLRQLAQQYGGKETYKAMIQRSRSREADVEATIRRLLRVQRYLQVASMLGGLPDAAQIEDLWGQAHKDVRYELLWVAYTDLADEARAELPGDEALRAWYEGLDRTRKAEFEEPERRSAEVVSFTSLDATPAAGLLAAFPEPPPEEGEPVSPEERAQQYYDQVYFWHFLAPLEPGVAEVGPPRYESFEEVKERALEEAPVYFALQRWLASMRESQETIDLQARAQELGLTYQAVPLETRAQIGAREARRNAGDTFAARVFQTAAGEFAYSVVPRGGALSVVRTTEVQPLTVRPFEEVKERVADLWVEERERSLATEKLSAARAALASEPLEGEPEHEEVAGQEHGHRYASAEAFRQVALDLGASVVERGWFDTGSQVVPTDPGLDAATNAFLRAQRQLASLTKDEVTPPLVDAASGRVYLVRLAERRPVPIDRLSPGELDAIYLPYAARVRRAELAVEPSLEFLEAHYGLRFFRGEDEGDAEGAEQQPADQAG